MLLLPRVPSTADCGVWSLCLVHDSAAGQRDGVQRAQLLRETSDAAAANQRQQQQQNLQAGYARAAVPQAGHARAAGADEAPVHPLVVHRPTCVKGYVADEQSDSARCWLACSVLCN
jgi:hypothetical protein